jgi:bisphosphoglycerate-independent phosphoglycerate mutase (AlkP superfamily)
MHHRDGMLWIRSPEGQPRIHEGTVSLQSIAPTILEMFGLPRPAHMAAESLPLSPGGATRAPWLRTG